MSVRDCVQCAAPTLTGNRCKNRTCIYTEFCNIHAKSILGLVLKKSGIPNSGKGLFTLVDIKKKQNIVRYTGEIISQDEHNIRDSGYGLKLSDNKIMDARSTQSCIGRYSNTCKTANKRAKHCKDNNARFVINPRNDTVWIRATKNIPANSEIFVSYGRGFRV